MPRRGPNVHQVILIEQEMPGAFEIRCIGCHTRGPHSECDDTCHAVEKTFWGEQHAAEIAAMHVWQMRGEGARFLPDGIEPERNLINPLTGKVQID